MKLDRFLALLFSKRGIALILLAAFAFTCLAACELTCEDVFCLTFFGCLSFDTCRELLWACDCDCEPASGGGEPGDSCDKSCIGDCYNAGFGCVWDNCLEDCRPSTLCSSCEGDGEEENSASCPSCDEYFIICTDILLNG